jgi:dihydrofolate reductase
MGTVVAVEYTSLDGVMEEPAWSGPYFNDELIQFQYNNLFTSDALLLGRTTYEGFKEAWPHMTDDEAGFGLRMNALPKYVSSNSLTEGEWNATLLHGDPAEQVAKLKQDFDGVLLINGSAQLFQALHAAGLIDEYRIMVYPVVVGAGKKLFGDGASGAATLKLTGSQITKSGVAVLTYQPDASAA